MRLRLESDAYMFDGAGDDGVGYTGEGAGGEVLAV